MRRNKFVLQYHQNHSTKMKISTIFYFCLGLASGFEIYWNVPTEQCERSYRMDFVGLLKNYRIRANKGGKFKGDEVTIFYENQLGLYPRILKSGKFENGGIPQRGDFTKHLSKAIEDLQKAIPSKDFNGVGIIDWEAWRPIWDFNWKPFDIYKIASLQLAKETNPTANDSVIVEIATKQWEHSAKLYMLETLRLAKKSRPNGRWGYYLFPDCYNYVGKSPKNFQCSERIRKGNDKLSWLWKESSALYPSIYVAESHLERYTFEQRCWRDNEKLRETLRVASPNAKIFPYINYFSDKPVPKEDIWRMLAQAAALGSDGAIIWGASASVNSEKNCKNLKQQIVDEIGPAAEKVAWRSDLCSKQICNGHGRCSFPNDDYAKAWKLFINDSVKSFYAGDIICRCSENYSGRFCDSNA